MRPVVLAAALAFASAPAALAQADLKAQFDAANQIFTAGAAGIEDYTTSTRTKLVEGIDGTWFPIWALGPEATADDHAKACDTTPINITTQNEFSFAMEQVFDGGKSNSTTIFSARGGNAFGSYTDPTQVVKRLGLDQSNAPPGALTSVLNGMNGISTIARPSPDILVVQTNYGFPQIFARCPG